MNGPSTNRSAAYPTWLPMPACPVQVAVGPPGPGCRAWVDARALPGAEIIDLAEIIERISGGRPGGWAALALDERNQRLAALAKAAPDAEAWLISPSPRQWQRDWWATHLGATVHLVDPGKPAALAAAAAAGVNVRFVHGWYDEAAAPDGWQIPAVRDGREHHLRGTPPPPRGSNDERGYGSRHGRMRADLLARQPWCERCAAGGRGRVPATDLNHRQPFKLPDGGMNFKLWGDPKNHEALCRTCHQAHGARTDRDASPLGAGTDGRPLDPNHPWNRK